MAELSFPLENTDYGAEEAQLWFSGRTSGVFAAEELAVSADEGMNVSLGDGRLWMAYTKFAGVVYANTVALILSIPTADAYFDRIDRVIVRFDRTGNTIKAMVISGAPSSNPSVPAITRNDSTFDISLAQIRVRTGSTEITAADITDERLDPAVCGLMEDGVTGIDTSVILEQWKAKLKELEELLLKVPGGTVPNAEMLGGKPAESYMPYTNLDDNSDFTKWVAQAGVGGKHGNETYGGDRWILTDGTIASTAYDGDPNPDGDGYSGITLNGTLVQVVPSPPAVATAFVEMVSGTATISYDATKGEIILTSAGGVIKNVLLLEGEWTEKPTYVSKGYAAELSECQRYFYIFDGEYIEPYGYVPGTYSRYIALYALPNLMRIRPAITKEAYPNNNLPSHTVVSERDIYFYLNDGSYWALKTFSACADLLRR